MYKCPFCSSIHKSLAKMKSHFIKTHLPLRKCPACGWESGRMRKDPRKAITSHIIHIISRPSNYTYEFWLKHVAWAYIYFRYTHSGGSKRRHRLRQYKKVALDYFRLTQKYGGRIRGRCTRQYRVPVMNCPCCGTKNPSVRLKHVGLGSFTIVCFNCSTIMGKNLVSLNLFLVSQDQFFRAERRRV